MLIQKIASFVCVIGAALLMIGSLRAHWNLNEGVSRVRSGVGLIASAILFVVGFSLLFMLPHMVVELQKLSADLDRWMAQGQYGLVTTVLGIGVVSALLVVVLICQGVSDLLKAKRT